MDLVELARHLATQAHAGPFRRDGTTPYIAHPAGVVRNLEGESAEVLAAAWLHDVVEDTATSPEGLRAAGIPESVVKAVRVLTKGDEDDADYLARVRGNPIARRVKMADLLHNLGDRPTERQVIQYARALLYLHDPDPMARPS